MEEVTETTVDVDAYFSRIGCLGGRAPTLETLETIIARHTEALPFENLNPLLRWTVRLDPHHLKRKWCVGVAADPVSNRICSSIALNALGNLYP